MHTAKGAGVVGISTALGTRALIGTFGAASTGTAISTLAGAAATNATLAWLGGGSLAAGGMGMAGGTAVLGGILIIPAVVITSVFSHISVHKKVRDLEEAITKALEAIATYKEASLKLSAMERRAGEVIVALHKSRETFDLQLRGVCRTLFPFGILSRMFRYLRQLFGGTYFAYEEVELISPILQMASALAELVDTRILDERANLV